MQAFERLDIYRRPEWQMSLGERAAIEGLLASLEPRLALEIGTAEGGSLERIAAHSDHVHAIDLSDELLTQRPPNVELHVGDSHAILPGLLEELEGRGERIDFVLVDGDHSAPGARADIETLLRSPATSGSLILVHDSINPDVRAGIESVKLAEHPRVRGFDLDFVSGRLGRAGAFDGQLFGGFALIVVADDRDRGDSSAGVDVGFWSLRPDPVLTHDSYAAVSPTAAIIDAGHEDPLGDPPLRPRLEPGEIAAAAARSELEALRSSWSWRITAPLRALAAPFRLRR